MTTQLFLAPAAAGKTAYVLALVRDAARRLGSTPLVVVPTHLQVRAWRRRLARASFRHLGRESVATFLLGRMSPQDVLDRTEVVGLPALQEAVAARGFEVGIGGTLYSDALGDPGTPQATYVGTVRSNVARGARRRRRWP